VRRSGNGSESYTAAAEYGHDVGSAYASARNCMHTNRQRLYDTKLGQRKLSRSMDLALRNA
jgi:hypothetical protein